MKILFRLSLPLILFLTAIGVLYSQPNPDLDKLDRYFTELEQNNRFMGTVFVMHGDEVLFNQSYGKSAADGTPAKPESIYRIGSITKSYTSTMILQLVDLGELTLDTTLGKYFPEMPNADQVTIEQMLRHQSGLVNFTNLPEYMEYFTDDRTKSEMLELFESIGTSFDPGEDTEYSNTAYVLLGYIIEDVTGMSYNEALQEMITGPLGFNSTYFASGLDPEKNEADSFVYQQGEWQPASRTNMFIPHGAGAIVSTAEETARFYRALLSDGMLSDELFEELTRFDGPFGAGLLRFPFGDRYLFGHNGGIDGYQSNSAYSPEDDMTFSLLANGVNYNFNDILIGFLSIAFDEEFEIPDFEQRMPVSLPEEQLDLYTGTYRAPNFPLAIELFTDSGNLMARATGQGAFPLTMYDEQTMAFEQAGIEIFFDEPENSRYTSFVFSQGGQSFRFSLEE